MRSGGSLNATPRNSESPRGGVRTAAATPPAEGENQVCECQPDMMNEDGIEEDDTAGIEGGHHLGNQVAQEKVEIEDQVQLSWIRQVSRSSRSRVISSPSCSARRAALASPSSKCRPRLPESPAGQERYCFALHRRRYRALSCRRRALPPGRSAPPESGRDWAKKKALCRIAAIPFGPILFHVL